jgi:hypothetical protein
MKLEAREEAGIMSKVLTRAEMEARYEGEWVLVEEPEVDDRLEVLRGVVTAHSTDRDVVDRADLERRPKYAALVYLGDVPQDMGFIL